MRTKSIIFLPGFMCDGRLFQVQKSALGRQGFDCLDGEITRSASIESIAKDILSHAPERFALVGLSMGGIVALEIIRQAPQRVSHLALLNTTANADKIKDQRKEQICRVASGQLDLVMQEELKPQYLAAQNRTKDRLDLLADMSRKLGEEVFARQSIALMNRTAAHDLLPIITCPTTVMTGRDDTVCTPEIHVKMADAIPDAALTVIAECGHLSSMEQPDAVTSAIKMLLQRQKPSETVNKARRSKLHLVKNG